MPNAFILRGKMRRRRVSRISLKREVMQGLEQQSFYVDRHGLQLREKPRPGQGVMLIE